MPTRSSKDHDFTRSALRAVEQAIGEQWDGSPLIRFSVRRLPDRLP
jgi:hypothetical protein